jgi:hypothetical protein
MKKRPLGMMFVIGAEACTSCAAVFILCKSIIYLILQRQNQLLSHCFGALSISYALNRRASRGRNTKNTASTAHYFPV